MIKRVILVLVLIFSTYSFAISDMNDNIKVEKTFKKMLRAYKNKNMKAFLHHVSKNRFQQDFLGFREDVQEDMQINHILSIDTWVDKITTDGKKRFLYIQWKKRYQSVNNSSAKITKSGKSMFLFDSIKGKYKLIDFGGEVLFGDI